MPHPPSALSVRAAVGPVFVIGIRMSMDEDAGPGTEGRHLDGLRRDEAVRALFVLLLPRGVD